jgi:hypothetical protein
MTREFIYDAWAPRDGVWSPWVKPVLFACMTRPPPIAPSASLEAQADWEVSWAPPPEAGALIVLDLPGAEGVHAVLALARKGYRPVPLYNAIPAPQIPFALLDASPLPPAAVVDLGQITAAIWNGTAALAASGLSPDAPPAFVLDANRHGHHRPGPGRFDNRSVSFTTDFPSANLLIARGLRRAILVRPTPWAWPGQGWPAMPAMPADSLDDAPRPDLAHTLRRWQDGGIQLESRLSGSTAPATPLHVRKPSFFGWAFQRAAAALGLRRGRLGGFGDWVPEASAG